MLASLSVQGEQFIGVSMLTGLESHWSRFTVLLLRNTFWPVCLSCVLRTPERASFSDFASLFSSGLLALSPLQAPGRPQSLGRARGWAPAEATARPSDPGQTKDLCSLHKPPQVSLHRDGPESHPMGFRLSAPLRIPCHLGPLQDLLKTASGITHSTCSSQVSNTL